MKSLVGLVVPLYNEESRFIPEYFYDLSVSMDVMLIFVDDGSQDDTFKLLETLVQNSDNMLVLRLKKNIGKANATRAGWIQLNELCECKFVGFLDADGAFVKTDIEKLVFRCEADKEIMRPQFTRSSMPSMDAYWSSRIQLSGRHIERSRKRYLLGRVLASIIKTIFRNLPWDTQSGLKIFRNDETFKSSISEEFKCRWLFDIELLLRLRRLTKGNYSVWEEPVDRWTDVPGSRVSLKGYFTILYDLVQLVYVFKVRRVNNGQG